VVLLDPPEKKSKFLFIDLLIAALCTGAGRSHLWTSKRLAFLHRIDGGGVVVFGFSTFAHEGGAGCHPKLGATVHVCIVGVFLVSGATMLLFDFFI